MLTTQSQGNHFPGTSTDTVLVPIFCLLGKRNTYSSLNSRHSSKVPSLKVTEHSREITLRKPPMTLLRVCVLSPPQNGRPVVLPFTPVSVSRSLFLSPLPRLPGRGPAVSSCLVSNVFASSGTRAPLVRLSSRLFRSALLSFSEFRAAG